MKASLLLLLETAALTVHGYALPTALDSQVAPFSVREHPGGISSSLTRRDFELVCVNPDEDETERKKNDFWTNYCKSKTFGCMLHSGNLTWDQNANYDWICAEICGCGRVPGSQLPRREESGAYLVANDLPIHPTRNKRSVSAPESMESDRDPVSPKTTWQIACTTSGKLDKNLMSSCRLDHQYYCNSNGQRLEPFPSPADDFCSQSCFCHFGKYTNPPQPRRRSPDTVIITKNTQLDCGSNDGTGKCWQSYGYSCASGKLTHMQQDWDQCDSCKCVSVKEDDSGNCQDDAGLLSIFCDIFINT